jgi:hypothetical protein
MDASRQPEWHSVNAEAGVAHPNLHDDMKKEDIYGDIHNDPFGNEEMAEVKYRTMKWW